MTPTPILLERLDARCNMARYYRLDVQPGLFADYGLVREWGRIGASGQQRTDWFASAEEAIRAQEKLAAAKRRKGYQAPALS